MLKIIGATIAVAFIAVTAGQALARNPLPQPKPPHIIVRCPPSSNPYVRTCV